jgi:DNA repair protein RadA/Sms
MFVCQACAGAFPRWEGQCRSCGAWNTLVETMARRAPHRSSGARPARAGGPAEGLARPLRSLAGVIPARRLTGLDEVDRTLGGGFVPGSLLLLAGEPGIGKSTLVLQVAGALADGHEVLYASAEETAQQLLLRADRLGLVAGAAGASLSVLASTEVETIIETAAERPPALLVVDSIQTVTVDELEGPPGSVGQVRDAAARLGAFARERGVPVLLVGHVTKDGLLAGPRTLEHLVDTVLVLEGDRYGSLRLLRALKNRHGTTEEVGVMEMTGSGLRGVSDAAAAFLGSGQRASPGVAVAAILEGSRPLLVEVQALVAPTGPGPPRRTVAGIDAVRLVLLIAVLARRGGLDVSGRDVYASLTGGLSVTEPALDLPLCLAVAASARDRAVPRDLLACGEVSLLGEVRPVPGLERRLREAARLGFRRAMVPAAAAGDGSLVGSGRPAAELELIEVASLGEALAHALGASDGTSG